MKPLRHPKVITDQERRDALLKRQERLQQAASEAEREEIYKEFLIKRITAEDYSAHVVAGCSLCTSHDRLALRPHDVLEEDPC